MDGIEQRMDGIEQRMDGIEQRMDGIEQRMDDIEQRMNGFEQHFAEEKKLNAARHQEILKELRYSNIEIEYLRNQSAKHDMEIYVLKQE
jgi:chromosome segregation ATPase